MRPFALLGPAVAAVLATAACASSSPYAAAPSAQPSPAPSASPVAVSPAPTGTEIQVGSSRLGQILVDSKGRTVYLFVADSGATSTKLRRFGFVVSIIGHNSPKACSSWHGSSKLQLPNERSER